MIIMLVIDTIPRQNDKYFNNCTTSQIYYQSNDLSSINQIILSISEYSQKKKRKTIQSSARKYS